MGRSNALIIAIDGPAGSGKSTVSKKLAEKLGVPYIDTGAMYRAITLKAMRRKVDFEDEEALVKLAQSTNVDLQEEGKLKVLLDGEDVASLIRTPKLTQNVKYIARVPGVRQEMVRLQRSIGNRRGAVLEGRDIGTVVFPNADYKFYLDADVDVRAERRYKELIALGQKVGLEDIRKDVVERDESDMKRAVGALKKAKGAFIIDTTDLSVTQVVDKILGYVHVD